MNRAAKSQERILLVTPRALYTLKPEFHQQMGEFFGLSDSFPSAQLVTRCHLWRRPDCVQAFSESRTSRLLLNKQ